MTYIYVVRLLKVKQLHVSADLMPSSGRTFCIREWFRQQLRSRSPTRMYVGRELNHCLLEILQPEDSCMPGERFSHLR